ncbi:MAG TPA: NYN domain-containing protein [Syntrophorhabdaceae bacterium]|nr:NYN domain-containing protein [Syntrophorhabdaceae bacterium]
MRRVGIFIDMQNIYLTTKTLYGKWKINFDKLREFFEKDDTFTTFSVFMCYDLDNQPQRSFLNALGLLGYRVISKPIRKLPDGLVKANMDLEIAVEIMSQADYLDEVILVSGDADFRVLVDFLCRKGKMVTVVGPEKFTSTELILSCHRFVSFQKIEGIMDID